MILLYACIEDVGVIEIGCMILLDDDTLVLCLDEVILYSLMLARIYLDGMILYSDGVLRW